MTGAAPSGKGPAKQISVAVEHNGHEKILTGSKAIAITLRRSYFRKVIAGKLRNSGPSIVATADVADAAAAAC